jgi:hypothetical protein
MTNTIDRSDVTTRRVRRVARIWSIVIIGITLFVAIGHIVAPEPEATDYPPIENLLPVLILLSVLGLAIAWRWEGIGGALNVGFFVANLVLYWIIRGRFFPFQALVILLPVVVPGLLFLVCWQRTKS